MAAPQSTVPLACKTEIWGFVVQQLLVNVELLVYQRER